MYELLSGNRGDLIPLNFPREERPIQLKHKGSSCYETVVFGALFCAVVDCALMRFLFYVYGPGSSWLTNLRGNNTRKFLPFKRVNVPDFPTPTVWYIILVLIKLSL